jgi:hypothetical protein
MSSIEVTSNGESGGSGAESVQELARKGSTAVRRLKRMTVGVLIGASLSIAGLVYVTSVNDEKSSFEQTVRFWLCGKICACTGMRCRFLPATGLFSADVLAGKSRKLTHSNLLLPGTGEKLSSNDCTESWTIFQRHVAHDANAKFDHDHECCQREPDVAICDGSVVRCLGS